MTIMSEEKKYIKKNQKLPEHIEVEFSRLSGNNSHRDVLIKSLVDANWTYEAISSASGLTRERVRQISNGNKDIDTGAGYSGVDIPEPPTKPERKKPEYVEPHPEILKRLLELQPYAQQVRANGTKYREEAEEYTRLLDRAHTKDGVTLYRLAKRLGVTHGALRFRLVRYGYKKPLTATSKVYQLIIQENRVIENNQ